MEPQVGWESWIGTSLRWCRVACDGRCGLWTVVVCGRGNISDFCRFGADMNFNLFNESQREQWIRILVERLLEKLVGRSHIESLVKKNGRRGSEWKKNSTEFGPDILDHPQKSKLTLYMAVPRKLSYPCELAVSDDQRNKIPKKFI